MEKDEFTVLIVDDDRTNRIVTEYALGKHFNIMSADSGEEALEIISNQRIAVLLTDQRMPGMSGIDLARKTIDYNPDIIRIIVTAYSDLPMAIDAINRGRINHFIKKPWMQEELISVVHQSIEQYQNTELVKKLQEDQIRYDRMCSLGILSSGIAHDMRQPLTYVVHFVHAMQRDLERAISGNKDSELDAILRALAVDIEDITRGVDVLTTLSENLLNHVNNNMPVKIEKISLNKIVNDVLSISKYTIKERANFIVEMPEDDIIMYSCKIRISQIILNLLLNAAQSITDGIPPDNFVSIKILRKNDKVNIIVADSGCGMSNELKKRIFEPQFTTKGCSGSGLGLLICKVNVHELGGKIEFETEVGLGTTFLVELPVSLLS